MDIVTLKTLLLYALAFNYGLLLLWFLVFLLARGPLAALHGRWFRLSPEQFDFAHYFGMAVYKIGIFLFILTPLVALWCLPRATMGG